MKTIEFTVHGPIHGKGRPRFTRVGQYVRTYTPDQTISYENLIKMEYLEENEGFMFGREVPLAIKITAFYEVPKSASQRKKAEMLADKIRPLKKPDSDNVLKVVCDALNGVAYHDDVQIVSVQVERFYALNPFLDVVLWEVGSEDGL